jgi:FkbM family methyltransferase
MSGESYDFEELIFLHYRPGAGDVVVDVGAGHGGETFALANMVGPAGSVLSIEAAPDTFRRLEQLCRLNHWKQVEAIHAAVSDKPGVVTISDGPEWIAANVFEPGVTEVRAVTLDDLCLERGITRIDWLKMNIEGAEKEAIIGTEAIAPMIRNMTISCHDFLGTEWARSKIEVTSWLVAHGFTVRGREYDSRVAAHDYVYAWR